jgi:hypothetical protein
MKEKNNSIIDPCGEEGVIIENIIVDWYMSIIGEHV